jgi:hypothetical protein
MTRITNRGYTGGILANTDGAEVTDKDRPET